MTTTKSILVLHGPNLNLLGMREPAHYGPQSLADLDAVLAAHARKNNVALEAFQSNEESALIARIHALVENPVDFLIINPAAFTHTSVALRDAISAVQVPFIEVHLSNIYKRETFRHHSFFSDIAIGVISGLGAQGYLAALDYAISHSE